HQDTMGNREIIRAGEVQQMSAGSGVMHSEMSVGNEETHLFQIWILPDRGGYKPRYGQKSFEDQLRNHKLVLTASLTGREGSIPIHQDADMYISRLQKNDDLDFKVRAGRGVWIQVANGEIEVGGEKLK